MRRKCSSLVLVVAVVIGRGLAQQAPTEKHVGDIKAEQTQDMISASPLCRQARAAHLPTSRSYLHLREVNTQTLEKTLPALMQKSDEVVLIDAVIRGDYFAVSPSGNDAIWYNDARVLRAWKGSHQTGDLLTFALPTGSVKCDSNVKATTDAGTITGRDDKSFRKNLGDHGAWGPAVLFLRHDDTGLIDGLRLTGGDGVQGMFYINNLSDILDDPALHACYDASFDGVECAKYDNSIPGCRDPRKDQVNVVKCNAALNASQKLISIGYGLDLLVDKYDGMPISKFLKKVDVAADSLGYAGQADSAK